MRTHTPIITNVRRFRMACRITAMTSAFSGRTRKAYNLIYGFRGNNLRIYANNLNDAFAQYQRKFEFYDHFIETNSFLLQ